METKQFFNIQKQSKIKIIYFREFNKILSISNWIQNNRVTNHNYRKYPAKVINIDFSKCRFLKPYHIVPLACLIYEYQISLFKIKIINVSPQLSQYFNSFGFDKLCNQTFVNNFDLPKDNKTFPLWRIEKAKIDIYPIQVKEYYENLHFKGKDLFSLSLSLAELMNNVIDHSGSKIPGFSFTQYNTKNEKIITCVCDLGIGIPNNVNKFLKNKKEPTLSNLDALLKAFELSFSTHSKPHNKGYGLDNIICQVKALKGSMLIISNDVIYKVLEDGSVINSTLDSNFPGTLFVLYLNARELPLKEEELNETMSIF